MKSSDIKTSINIQQKYNNILSDELSQKQILQDNDGIVTHLMFATSYMQDTYSRCHDLVFLDADMPGMNGYDLCKQIRQQPQHAKTPVVFVTGLTDFASRAKSTISGGNDLIAKPFLIIELAVKALTFLMKAQFKPGPKPA